MQILSFGRNYYYTPHINSNRRFFRSKFPHNTNSRYMQNTHNRGFGNRLTYNNNQPDNNRFQNKKYFHNSQRRMPASNTNFNRLYTAQAEEQEHFLGDPDTLEETLQSTENYQHSQ